MRLNYRVQKNTLHSLEMHQCTYTNGIKFYGLKLRAKTYGTAGILISLLNFKASHPDIPIKTKMTLFVRVHGDPSLNTDGWR